MIIRNEKKTKKKQKKPNEKKLLRVRNVKDEKARKNETREQVVI